MPTKDELREILDSLEQDLENINRGISPAHTQEQRITAIASALSVLMNVLISAAPETAN